MNNMFFHIERDKTDMWGGIMGEGTPIEVYHLVKDLKGNQAELYRFVADLLCAMEEGKRLFSIDGTTFMCRYITENIPIPLDGIILCLNHFDIKLLVDLKTYKLGRLEQGMGLTETLYGLESIVERKRDEYNLFWFPPEIDNEILNLEYQTVGDLFVQRVFSNKNNPSHLEYVERVRWIYAYKDILTEYMESRI